MVGRPFASEASCSAVTGLRARTAAVDLVGDGLSTLAAPSRAPNTPRSTIAGTTTKEIPSMRRVWRLSVDDSLLGYPRMKGLRSQRASGIDRRKADVPLL
jgi:hypothetical protein